MKSMRLLLVCALVVCAFAEEKPKKQEKRGIISSGVDVANGLGSFMLKTGSVGLGTLAKLGSGLYGSGNAYGTGINVGSGVGGSALGPGSGIITGNRNVYAPAYSTEGQYVSKYISANKYGVPIQQSESVPVEHHLPVGVAHSIPVLIDMSYPVPRHVAVPMEHPMIVKVEKIVSVPHGFSIEQPVAHHVPSPMTFTVVRNIPVSVRQPAPVVEHVHASGTSHTGLGVNSDFGSSRLVGSKLSSASNNPGFSNVFIGSTLNSGHTTTGLTGEKSLSKLSTALLNSGLCDHLIGSRVSGETAGSAGNSGLSSSKLSGDVTSSGLANGLFGSGTSGELLGSGINFGYGLGSGSVGTGLSSGAGSGLISGLHSAGLSSGYGLGASSFGSVIESPLRALKSAAHVVLGR